MRPPRPGEVIRYTYLWEREARDGRIEGVKNRPCAVVLGVVREDAETHVVVAPITHAPPDATDEAIEIPPTTKQLVPSLASPWSRRRPAFPPPHGYFALQRL